MLYIIVGVVGIAVGVGLDIILGPKVTAEVSKVESVAKAVETDIKKL